jgi:hypothetical protein
VKPAETKLFKALKTDVSNLFMFWQVYKQLYDGSKKRIDLLNATGSYVFYILQILFTNEMILGISKLTDPAHSKVRGANIANLSIRRLIEKVDGRSDRELKNNLNNQIKLLADSAKPFRAQRNKLVAHRDLATSLQLRTKLEGVTKHRSMTL